MKKKLVQQSYVTNKKTHFGHFQAPARCRVLIKRFALFPLNIRTDQGLRLANFPPQITMF